MKRGLILRDFDGPDTFTDTFLGEVVDLKVVRQIIIPGMYSVLARPTDEIEVTGRLAYVR